MEQETTINHQSRTEKVYKDREIWVGTLLGGTLTAGYMVAENYKAFGETGKVRKTWFITIATTAILFLVLFFAPYVDRLPNHLFSLVCAGIIIVLAQLFQGEKINAHIRAGGRIQSWWKTLGVGFIGLAVTLIPILGIAMIEGFTANANVTTKTYGTLKHEILFERDNITEAEVNKIGNGFTQTNFFDKEKQKFVDVKKVSNSYEIALYCNDSIKTDTESNVYFNNLRNDMQKLFPDNKIIFNLVIDTPENIVKRLE